ncbi:hypothetical protein M8A51_00910 [Schlegelella sp. S2-27]|uniref:Response regulator receiver domain-containing protein n=1 Tax=Caldimonas mangrovi TaxID=2944811 RepID=A0ABT0YI38_9BURK|nr:tetratricopeptide repeat protein [Caldimonas mangrovi]MCM5678089.1 hypothetical protein [Caldimonas mangrovi]
MQALDAEIGNATALVIDGDTAWRSIVSAMLRNLGIGQVQTCPVAEEAQELLRVAPRDIVVCTEVPASAGRSSNLATLRAAGLLPASTMVVLICPDPVRVRHVEALELADACLQLPCTEHALGERLAQARQRQHALADVIAALQQGRHAEVDRLCRGRHATRAPYWVQALRLAAQLHLDRGDPFAAREMYEAVLASRALPWARLGLARALTLLGEPHAARALLQRLLDDHPLYADALAAWSELARHVRPVRRANRLVPVRAEPRAL